MSKKRVNMEALASSLPRKCSPCLFIHHHRHCHHHHHVHHHHHHGHHVHHHHHHGHHVHHHHHPFHYHQSSRHNPESLPDASPRMKLEQGHGFQFPQEEEKDEDEDEEPVFVMTDEWKEFFTKSEAKRRSERKKAKNKGRNTE